MKKIKHSILKKCTLNLHFATPIQEILYFLLWPKMTINVKKIKWKIIIFISMEFFNFMKTKYPNIIIPFI